MDQGQKMFVSADGTFRLVFVQARPELGNYRECAAWLQDVRAAVQAVRTSKADFTGVEVHFTGRPVFVAEISPACNRI